jgi:nucleoside-diphosphate-sugar epimerase
MYLVTGGSGFCGLEIVKHLLSKGEKVRVFDLEPLPEHLPVDFVRADIRDFAAVQRAAEGVTRIIHTVAKVPISKAGKDFWTVNVGGTKNVLEVALNKKIQKVVHLSSSSVQLSEKNPVPENAPFNPIGEYARSKMEAEKVCLEYLAKGVRVDRIRPRTVVGIGRLGIFDILFEWISEGRNIYILGSGRNKIQFLDSRDLASCCYLASLNPNAEDYNVGGKDFGTLREDLEALIAYSKKNSKVRSLPVWPALSALAVLDFLHLSPLASWHYLTYHKDFYFTNEKPKALLGWQPQYGNREVLINAFTDYLKARSSGRYSKFGTSHRKALKQGILKILKWIS